jgi:hypothetical protein
MELDSGVHICLFIGTTWITTRLTFTILSETVSNQYTAYVCISPALAGCALPNDHAALGC